MTGGTLKLNLESQAATDQNTLAGGEYQATNRNYQVRFVIILKVDFREF